jgi:hypothetical protein
MPQSKTQPPNIVEAIRLLDAHCKAFYEAHPLAQKFSHPVPSDTRAWSQILVSILTGKKGLAQKKGADLEDGSDVKGANCWEAIDTPRFNGVIPSGRKSKTSRKSLDISALENVPHIYFVLWDNEPDTNNKRCRVWCVRASKDKVFQAICAKWYQQKITGEIKSDNFQLHPPRNKNTNVIRNTCGNFEMPLLFSATKKDDGFVCDCYAPEVIQGGECVLVGS